ncbi:MAG: alpha/beta fold hydrolase [Leptospiraceae bacterium]|nr:alpha/beta fold hydrolase [Leptospiraceae bacterium]MCP5497979.1 alpha/beta fold hydrolase [Leptospiraceae bacterium]
MEKRLFSDFGFTPTKNDLYIHSPNESLQQLINKIKQNFTNLMAKVQSKNGNYYFTYTFFEAITNDGLKIISLVNRRAMLRTSKGRDPKYFKSFVEMNHKVSFHDKEHISVRLIASAYYSKLFKKNELPVEFINLEKKEELPLNLQSFIRPKMKMAVGVPICTSDQPLGILWGITPFHLNKSEQDSLVERLVSMHKDISSLIHVWLETGSNDVNSLGKLIENIDLFFRYDKVFSVNVPFSTNSVRTVIGYSYSFEKNFRTDSDIVIPTNKGFSISLKRYLPEKVKDKKTVMLMIPGFFCNRELMKLLAREMSIRFGYEVFTLDLRGRSSLTLPTFNKEGWTVDDYIMEDFPVALNWLKEQYPNTKFVVYGHSMGGMIPRFYLGSYNKILQKGLQTPLPDPQELIKAVVTITSPTYVNIESEMPGFDVLKKAVSIVGKFHVSNIIIRAISKTISTAMPAISLNDLFQFIHRIGKGRVKDLSYTIGKKVLTIKNFVGYYQITTPEWYHVLEDIFCKESIKTIAQFLKAQVSDRNFCSFDDSINYTQDQKNFTLPLFTVVGSEDRIAPPNTVMAANDLVRSTIKEMKSYPQGHLGIIVHPGTVKEIAEDTYNWLQSIK